ALVDMFGDYSYMFYMCGAVMLTAGLFLFAMNFYNYRRKDAIRHAREKGAELAERNVQNELLNGDTRTNEQMQEGDEQSHGMDCGTLE
ncbi:monocarboxylate transporter 2-like, partial [Clarias magur]